MPQSRTLAAMRIAWPSYGECDGIRASLGCWVEERSAPIELLDDGLPHARLGFRHIVASDIEVPDMVIRR